MDFALLWLHPTVSFFFLSFSLSSPLLFLLSLSLLYTYTHSTSNEIYISTFVDPPRNGRRTDRDFEPFGPLFFSLLSIDSFSWTVLLLSHFKFRRGARRESIKRTVRGTAKGVHSNPRILFNLANCRPSFSHLFPTINILENILVNLFLDNTTRIVYSYDIYVPIVLSKFFTNYSLLSTHHWSSLTRNNL